MRFKKKIKLTWKMEILETLDDIYHILEEIKEELKKKEVEK